MSKIKTLRKALEAAEAGGNVGAIIVAKQALQLGITKKLLDKVNATEADGASQIDGNGYGDDGNSRTIPGTNTIQSPVETPELSDDAARERNAGITKTIKKRIAEAQAAHARDIAFIKKQREEAK